MENLTLDLYKARDAEESYAIGLPGDIPGEWKAQSGFGQDYEKVWTIELQSEISPEVQTVNWNTVLDRAIQAYQLSDPVITNFEWPHSQSYSRKD